ncbi:MAG: hypothetical protein K0S61_674 [Anaerocolumna sp.]|jgi:Mor family transcriptional regulator|nr:hypothetical protein [Anaerocolumna sp.]
MSNLSEYIGKTFTVSRNETIRKVKIKEVLRDRMFLCTILKNGKELYRECFFEEDILRPKEIKERVFCNDIIERNRKIAEGFKQGKTRKELSKEFNLSLPAITGVVKVFSSKKRTIVREVN